MAKHLTIIALVGLALSPFAATSLAAIPLGATAAATQPDNALVELVAKRGSARSGGRAHIAGTQKRSVGGATSVAGTRMNVASRNTNVASGKTSVVNRNTNVVNRTANVNINRAANVNVRPGGYVRPANYWWRLAARSQRARLSVSSLLRLQRRGPALLLRQDIAGSIPIRVEPKGFWDACR